MKTVERPKIADKSDPRYFSIKTRGVTAYKVKAADGETERYLIEGIASSSVEDRYGDTLTEACQASMLSQASGLTMWLNHSYNVPEDIAGTCVDPTLQRATADDGTTCLDLKITLEIDPTNPRALKSWQSVSSGVRLAFSIGGYFKEFDVQESDEYFYTLLVHDIELLEISLVGIPANPRAYTKAFDLATEALQAAVVARAEQIVKEAADTPKEQVRMLVRKSFGLAAGEVKTVDKCAHKDGCEEQKADDSIFCVTHREAAKIVKCSADGCGELPIDGAATCEKHAEPEKKAVTDEHQQHQIVECMKSISACVNCEGHQMCAQPMAHASAAHAILKAMLPDDYDIPGDAALAVNDFTIKVGVELDKAALTEQLDAARKAFEAEQSDLNAQLEALRSETEQLSSGKVALEKEQAELAAKIAELKATPTGRSTKSYPGGSSNGSESTVTPEMYQRNATELSESAARSLRTNASDARQSVQIPA